MSIFKPKTAEDRMGNAMLIFTILGLVILIFVGWLLLHLAKWIF